MIFARRLTRRPISWIRPYATKAPLSGPKKVAAAVAEPETNKSTCSANTVLPGLNYLKGQFPVVALPDEEYPPWLWTILQPKVWPDDGPGGKAEKVRMRKENRQRIKDQNFMKTQ